MASLALFVALPLTACLQPQAAPPASAPQPRATSEEATAALANLILDGKYSAPQVAAMVHQGADAAYRHDSLGELVPLIYYAAGVADAATLQALEQGGAQWSQLSKLRLQLALINASCDGSAYAVQGILAAGADVDWTNEQGEKAMLLAADEEICTSPERHEILVTLAQAYRDSGFMDGK